MRRELFHHGIKGQKWGKRNGPPYPLKIHSVSERKALDKANKKGYNKDRTIERGRYAVGSILGKIGDTPVSELDANNLMKNIKMLPRPESVEEVLRNVNTSHGGTNCSACVVATPLRLCGYDVTAAHDIPSDRKQIYEVAKAFRIDSTNSRDIFDVGGPTVERLSRNIEKRYKDGDVGAIAFMWNDRYKALRNLSSDSGHTLNWTLQDGKVRLFDTQCGKDDDFLRQFLACGIDNKTSATVTKLANTENGIDLTKDVNMEILKRYIK